VMPANPIEAEATEWAVRLETEALTAEENASLEAWLAADVRHRGALLRARAIWANLDRLAALSAPAPLLKDSLLDPLVSRSTSNDARPNLLSCLRTFPRRVPASLVAACLAMTAMSVVAALWLRAHTNVYVTKVGEVRPVTLSDGSRIFLNTASEAAVHYDAHAREIELQAGEGLFQVAKDATRPFVVHVGPVSVRAVGTVFAVRLGDERVDVTVTEGTVEVVDHSPAGNGLVRRITANEHATVTETRQIEVSRVSHDEAERQLAWRNGIVRFVGEPLSAAVEEINRHNERHIVIDDPALAGRSVAGIFHANDPADFAATVATVLGAQSVEADDAIHLRTRAAP
jgi:transmembrane sensor